VENIYFIQEGLVTLELFYLIQQTTTFPSTENEVNRNTMNTVVKRMVRKIGHARQFGFEEMIKCMKERIFRARVFGPKAVEVLYLSKKHWLRLLDQSDVQDYTELSAIYVDF